MQHTQNLLAGMVRRMGLTYRRIASSAKRSMNDGGAALQSLAVSESRRQQLRERLVILDDIFPQLLSAFRIAEYNRYLKQFGTAEVHSTAGAFPLVGEKRRFSEVLEEYESYYPQHRHRVYRFSARRNYESRLIYTVFINNAFRFIRIAERHNVPFVFTLYPGGGFHLYEAAVDDKVRRVCSSPTFRKVIVTQRVSYDYLVERELCDPGKVEFIYGVVVPSDRLAKEPLAKKYYQKDKDTFDICFIAGKYTAKGVDKGYDVFVDVARLLARRHGDILFHVVGPFDETDIEIADIRDRVRFYGPKHTDFFPAFYAHMDIMLSLSIPFLRSPGNFDGFPTASSIEAGLCGVAVFSTDMLNLNVAFKNGHDIVIIPRDAEEVCGVVNRYYTNYDGLCELARRGQEAFGRVFAIETQMRPRLRVLSEYLVQ